jgi:DNA-binding CsgD family transcriptional regulator
MNTSAAQAVTPHRLAPSARQRRLNVAQKHPLLPQGIRENLTGREREVLECAGQGLSIKGIAQTLGISSGTVTWHLKNCYRKYGVNSREQALRQARLGAQVLPLGTAVCTCGRMHTLYGPAPMNSPTLREQLAMRTQGEQK